MKVGIPKEVFPGECRVAATPRTIGRLQQLGFEVLVEYGAGERAEFPDAVYREANARLVDAETVWSESDIILKVRAPQVRADGSHEVDGMRDGACLIGFLWPSRSRALLDRMAERGVTALAMDCVPRITRAQSMDALSAMANLAGYRAIIEAANAYPRLFGGQVTAAGRVPPAKVLVIGGGVAGLAAIAAARGLGAIVRAFDTRQAVREQVESLGGEFLELEFEESGEGGGGYAKVMSPEFIEAEMALFAQQAMEVDIIVTTALVPGREAPKLITAGMVESMKEGSVIVDLAAQQGGNCVLTKPDQMLIHKGVRIIGYTDLVSRMAIQSSWLYGSTLVNLVEELGGAEDFKIDLENEIVRGALVVHDGEVTWPPPKPPASATGPSQPEPASPEPTMDEEPPGKARPSRGWIGAAVLPLLVLAILALGTVAPPSFMSHFTVFVLACFVGWQVVWNVTPALHTPLMSVTNAISGIIILGGMLQISGSPTGMTTILGAAAILIATINIAGGFLVTSRMLAMFRR